MIVPKKYFQDRVILLLISVDVFLTLMASLTILFRLNDIGGHGFITQYRGNLGISGFQTGSLSDIVAFVLFAFMALIIHVALSLKFYPIRRQLAVVVLVMGGLLLILTAIVGNALLALR